MPAVARAAPDRGPSASNAPIARAEHAGSGPGARDIGNCNLQTCEQIRSAEPHGCQIHSWQSRRQLTAGPGCQSGMGHGGDPGALRRGWAKTRWRFLWPARSVLTLVCGWITRCVDPIVRLVGGTEQRSSWRCVPCLSRPASANCPYSSDARLGIASPSKLSVRSPCATQLMLQPRKGPKRMITLYTVRKRAVLSMTAAKPKN